MYTEDEAKKLWCPEGRTPYADVAANADNDFSGKILTTCVTSRCMMWRWDKEISVKDIKRGYCGKGGKP